VSIINSTFSRNAHSQEAPRNVLWREKSPVSIHDSVETSPKRRLGFSKAGWRAKRRVPAFQKPAGAQKDVAGFSKAGSAFWRQKTAAADDLQASYLQAEGVLRKATIPYVTYTKVVHDTC